MKSLTYASSVFLATSFLSWINNFVEMNIFKTLQRLETVIYLLRIIAYQVKLQRKEYEFWKCNVYYVTKSGLLFIFSCCSLYVQLTHDRPFTKQGWIASMGNIWLPVQSRKKKEKHGKYSVEVHNEMHST